jgi:hypothetical protein
MPPAASRGRLSSAFRFVRRIGWASEYRRLQALAGIGAGGRAFLVGNGPSLGGMDLRPLQSEFVCLTNMGLRAVGGLLPHADMHVLLDTHRYRRFASEIEELAARRAVTYRFLNLRMRRRWRRARKAPSPRPFFLASNPEKLVPGQPVPDSAKGVAAGSSVLLSAALLLHQMGFKDVYVIGCDLDYGSGERYFYGSGELDRVHEADPVVMGKRQNMTLVNAQFAALRADLEPKGTLLANAGLGGNLDSLPRVAFDSLFNQVSV